VDVSVRKLTGLLLSALLLTASLPAFADGEAVFRKNCATCHANDGSGKTSFAARARIPDLRSKEVQSLTDEELYSSIARGTRHKAYPHAFEMRGMPKSEVDALVVYLRSIKK